MEIVLSLIKKLIPAPLLEPVRRVWHPLVSLWSAASNGFPAKSMVVIGINGTKGKSTTADMLFAILRKAGHKTALASTIRFAINDESEPNLFKMTMPGRGYIQHFLALAKSHRVTHAVVELTTEGAREWRHRFLSLNGLIMLNVQKEHIERFGSFEKYIDAKWWIVKELERSKKESKVLVVHTEGRNAEFKEAFIKNVVTYSEKDLVLPRTDNHSVSFIYKSTEFMVPMPGMFNALNALGAIKIAEHLGISLETCSEALRTLPLVRGRLESIDCGQPFKAVVDYAHTPDSLQALYDAFPNTRKVCVLGNTGGGRDTWKRPEMGRIADTHCDTVILTNEDPYDEDPEKILKEMAAGMKREPTIIMDRREAIRTALHSAKPRDVVLISGKGTDPYIMEAHNKKMPWDDATVVREELAQLLQKTV